MGAPHSDQWISKHKNILQNTKLVFGVGGSLDVIAGKIKETPLFWRKIHLEWLYRMINVPAAKGQTSRWKRQLKTMPLFIMKAIVLEK